MNKVLLISEDTIKSNSEISDNLWGKNLLPAIRTSQDLYLQETLGSCLYKKILALVENGEISLEANVQYKDLLDDYITPYLIERVVADLIPIVYSKVSNLGVFKSNDEYANNIPAAEVDRLQYQHVVKADHYQKRMQDFLAGNRTAFPELASCSCGEVKPNLDSSEDCGLWLGGPRSRIIR